MLRTMHNASTGWSPADAPYPRYHIPDSRPQAFIYVYSTKSRLTDKYPTDDPAAFLGPGAPEGGVAGVDDRYGDRQRSSGM